jgi:hypothetical protein
MNHKDKRIRAGEKFIEEPAEGPYQFDDVTSAEDLVSLPNGSITVRSTIDGLIDAMAAFVFTEARASVSQFGDFQLALSSEEVLYPLYERLMYDPNVRGIPWNLTHLWCLDHEKNCTSIVQETIINHADIPENQVRTHLPEASRIDCLILGDNMKIPTEIPAELEVRFVVVRPSSVEDCQRMAKAYSSLAFRGFVLQENH